MVPSRVVRGGLFTTSSGSSNFPLGLTGLLVSWLVVSIKQSSKRKTNSQKNSITKLQIHLNAELHMLFGQ